MIDNLKFVWKINFELNQGEIRSRTVAGGWLDINITNMAVRFRLFSLMPDLSSS